MAALSPAVVISCMIDLNNNGYGKHKELTPIALLSISLDNIIGITIATILVKYLIPNDSSVSKALIYNGIPTDFIIFVIPIFLFLFGIFPALSFGFGVGKLT